MTPCPTARDDSADALDLLLTLSSPVVEDDLRRPGVDQALARIGVAARAEAGPPTAGRTGTRRRRTAAAVSAVVCVVVAVGGLPAAADWISLRTGQHDTGTARDPQPKTDDNEFWRMDSPELKPYLEEFARDYPLAPGYTLAPLTLSAAGPNPTLDTKLGVRGSVFFFSECTWVDTWLKADRLGDDDAKRAATAVLAGLPDKLDRPVALAVDQNGRDLQMALARAASEDEPAPLRRELKLNCGDLQ